MLELTLFGNGQGNLILGVKNNIIKYKIEKGEQINFNPLNEQRIVLYSKYGDGRSDISKEDISMNPEINYFPVVVGHNNDWQNNLGKIIEIKEVV